MFSLQLGGFIEDFLVPTAFLGGLLALLVGVVGRIWVERYRSSAKRTIERATDNDSGGSTHDVQSTAADAEPDDASVPAALRQTQNEEQNPLLQTAQDRFIDDDFRGTIQAAYMHARKNLVLSSDVEASGTHWDFFERYHELGLEEESDELNELTYIYERAVFHSESSSRAEAERALELSIKLSEGSPTS